jgi:hypothetical protein
MGAQIDGDVLCDGAVFEGEVWFIGARIGGDLDFSRANFAEGKEPADLVLTRAEIAGRLFFRKVTGAAQAFTLRGTSVAALVDDMASWEKAAELLLDGFRYNRFVDAEVQDGTQEWVHHFSPIDSDERIRWLDRQRRRDLIDEFKPQPWEQLIKVLREVGYQEGAKKVAIAKQQRIRKSKLAANTLHRIYSWLCSYGYRPGRLIVWAIVVWLISAGVFELAAHLGVMTPTDWRVLADTTDPGCRPEHHGNWTTCQSLRERGYPSFDPLVYSFDLIVPVIATQQTKDWTAATSWRCRHSDRWGFFCERLFEEDVTSTASEYWPLGLSFWIFARFVTLTGWAFGLLFVAIVSGLIKKD